MKVLVIGSGGREHAICRSFAKSERVEKIYCANGNAGIADVAECVPISPLDVARLAEFASENSIYLTFVGGETSLALGVVDKFESRGLRIVGPSKAASQLESSKGFAKDLMRRHRVPTARYVNADSRSAAINSLKSGELGGPSDPVVVKADGLAAGKGVVMAADRGEGIEAIEAMSSLVGDAASQRIVLEECLFGTEVSLLMFADGEDYALMPPTRDHKRIGENDTGPNTGGMGTITGASLLTSEQIDEIARTIIRPTLEGCVAEGIRFRGILFLGLMMTADGPKLLEYNVRFGDPETQAILVRLDTDLVDICESMLEGSLVDVDIKWKRGSSACVVLASEGYPGKPRTGDLISGIDAAAASPGVEVYHAGTASAPGGGFQTSGGRVLGVTATGNDLAEALAAAYSGAASIRFEGMQYRRDIGR